MKTVRNWVQRPMSQRKQTELRRVACAQPTICDMCQIEKDLRRCDECYDASILERFSIGDYVFTDSDMYPQGGYVVGVISNIVGEPVCYKVFVTGDDASYIDFLPAEHTTLWGYGDGSPAHALEQLGYVATTKDGCKYYNEEVDDVCYL